MNETDRQKRLVQILDQAFQLPEEERTEFLDTACGDDEELRKAATSLLASAGLDTVLSPTDVPGRHDEATEIPSNGDVADYPQKIGPYSICGVLGEGGMGRVFLAEQHEPVERQVALKLVHASLRSPAALTRFANERQAMARLSHPNIAQLFEAGTTADGFPYFAMELVDGKPITTYCDRHGLTVDERLRLFVQLCEGVQHAHRKGILHRDLKPSNLLVTEAEGRPTAKVIDFGIAKALDRPHIETGELTGTRLVGTPDYMSPEACAGKGEVDTRSDVYSLGVVLYRLLTGVRPEQADGGLRRRPSARVARLEADTRAVVAEQRSMRSQELIQKLEGDLDWIVMTAIADEPDARYGSPEDLASDIERYLASEAIEARPPSALYRLSKLANRHRVAAASALVFVLTLALGIVGTSVGFWMAVQEARAAREAQAEADEVSEFLVELFQRTDPFNAEVAGLPRGEHVTARELLDLGVERLQSGEGPRSAVRARVLATLGRVYASLDLPDQAQPLLEDAVRLSLRDHGEKHPDTIRAQRELGRLLESLGDYDAAEQAYRDSYANAQSLLGRRHPETVLSHLYLAKLLLTTGDVKTAEPMLEESTRVARQVLGPDDPVVTDGLNALAWLSYSQGDLERAEERFRRTLEIGLERFGIGVDEVERLGDPGVAVVLNNLAWVLVRRDKIDEAEPMINTAIRIFEHALPADHWRLQNAKSILGSVRASQGRFEEAEELLVTSLDQVRAATGEQSPYTTVLLERLVDLYRRWGRDDEAVHYLPENQVAPTSAGPDASASSKETP